MRCNNCGRHVENHERMFRRPVKNTIGRITTRRVELVCENCLPEINMQMSEYRKVMKKSAYLLLVIIAITYLISFLVAFFAIIKG